MTDQKPGRARRVREILTKARFSWLDVFVITTVTVAGRWLLPW